MVQPPTVPPPGPPPPLPPPPPGGPAYGARPPKVTAGATILFVVGGLGALYSLLGFVAIPSIADVVEGLEGAGTLIGVLTVVFVILLILSILQIVSGARVLGLRRSARILGIVASVVSLLLWLLVVVAGVSQGTADPIGITVGVLSIGGDVAILVLLGQSGYAFTA